MKQLIAGSLAAVLLQATLDAAETTRPNIVFIFSDDHAQHAISAYGSKVNQTPNIDRLAAAGARFTNSFVTNSICTPSRAKPTEVEVTQPDGTKKTLSGKELTKWKYQRYMQDYLACVQGVDDSVGKVLAYLDKSGLAKNTIVIYSADNGWYLGDLGLYDKRFMYEPGLKVPLLACGPGIKAGSTPAQFVANIDLAPTFLDLAGLPVPASMQGRSLAPLLRGESPTDWRTSVYYRYYHDPGDHNTAAHFGVRTATHKLIHFWKKNAYEMFDLTKDPAEQHNLLHDGANDPAIAARFSELKAEIVRLQKEYKDEGQYADSKAWPAASAYGPFTDKPTDGEKTIAEATALSGAILTGNSN